MYHMFGISAGFGLVRDHGIEHSFTFADIDINHHLYQEAFAQSTWGRRRPQPEDLTMFCQGTGLIRSKNLYWARRITRLELSFPNIDI